MKNFVFLFITLFLISCYYDIHFTNGKSLAIKQDTVFCNYETYKIFPDSSFIEEMKNNYWVKVSNRLAPSNLVIRQLCLIDIFTENPGNAQQIYYLTKSLSEINNDFYIWLEGYSYWEYTRKFLEEWVSCFYSNDYASRIRFLLLNIDMGFLRTSYLRDSLYYPAPFGDLRDEPIRKEKQAFAIYLERDGNYDIINKYKTIEDTLVYIINGKPLGLNNHIQRKRTKIKIVDGKPINFNFYTGYENKYDSKFDEYWDILYPSRMISCFKPMLRIGLE